MVKLTAFRFGACIAYGLDTSAIAGEDIAVKERCHDHLLAGHGGVVDVEGLLFRLCSPAAASPLGGTND